MQSAASPGKKWVGRVGWFVWIWAVSVSALGVVALFFRLIMRASGLTA